jgi:hypothetical protein
MELIDRYLHAIRRNLPEAKAEDIVAELRDDLMSRVEDREEGLGRPLTKDETSALLKEFGHPLVVASRFRTHQYLIGPAIFPFYLSVMRIVLMIVVAIVLAVSIGKAVFSGGDDMLRIWADSMSGIFSAVLVNAAIITLVFAVLERTNFAAEHKFNWTPDQLPDVIDKQPGPWGSAAEVALSIAFILWWTGVIVMPWHTGAADFRLQPSPVFAELYLPILILASARLVHNLVQWLRPRWKGVLALTNAATALGGLAILFVIYQSGHLVTVVSTGMAAEQVGKLQESLDLSFRIAVIVIGVVWTLQCLGALWRLVRGRTPVS